MSRKVFLAATLSLVLISLDVLALGLGGLRTESALNQPFSGEIDLVDVNADELDTIRATLASADAFAKAGVERYHFLTRLAFDPQRSPRGTPVIRVTSREPIREPFVDFLVEIVWPSGKVVKEYTVLLDPPGTADRRAPEVAPPGIADRRPVAPGAYRPTREAAQAEVPSKAPAERAQPAAGPVQAGSDAFPMQFGPVRPAEGIWRVARSAQPDGATSAQTAMALYRNNQDAFIDGDINRLRVGKTLIIPTRAELFALDASEAERELQAALQGRAVRRSPITDVTPVEPTEDAPLRIAGVAAGGAASPNTAPLETASEMPAAPLTPSADVPDGAPPPSLGASESADQEEIADQETEELRGRVQELETQLLDLQASLQMRNEELERLQEVASAGTVVDVIGDPIEQPLLDTDDLVESQVGVVDADAVIEVDASAPDDVRPVDGTAPDQISDIEPTPADPDPLAPTAVLQDAPVPPAEPESQPEPEPATGSTWHSFLLPLAGFAAVTALGVLAISWLAMRRRRRERDDDDDLGTSDRPSLDEATRASAMSTPPATESSIAAGREDQDFATQHSALSSPGLSSQPDAGLSAASSRYSALSQFDAETDEADAISEADIYIAYGRYKEAEELLKREIERSPERHDVRYKLAEVYAGAENLESLHQQIDSIAASGGDRADPARWRRLGAIAALVEQGGVWDPSVMLPITEEIGEDQLEAAPDRDASGRPGEPSQGLAESADKPRGESVEPLSLDLADLGSPQGEQGSERHGSPSIDAATASSVEDDLPLLLGDSALIDELELPSEVPDQTDQGPRRLAEPGSSSGSTGAGELNLTVDDLRDSSALDLDTFLESDSGTDSAKREAADLEVSSLSLPVEPLGDGPGALSGSASSGVGAETSEGVPSPAWPMDSGIWDENATKLDLARAYIDMGDALSARDILDEVVAGGREEQKLEAQALLRTLD
jgi:pilus assembly protein FimV